VTSKAPRRRPSGARAAATRIALVIKRSQWRVQLEEKKDGRLARLVDANDASVAALRAAHEQHERTVAEVRDALEAVGAEVAFVKRAGETFDSRGLDLVVTVGGDGTLLAASHSVDSVPVLGVNSAPRHSVGFFCGVKSGHVLAAVERAVRGELRPTVLTRMKVCVNGQVVAARVLNDALLCHASPAATSRYVIELDGEIEKQKSSGFWIGPAAGSTAAQRSAGGRVLPLSSPNLQLVVREPYAPHGESYAILRRLVKPGETLVVRSKMHDAKLFFDGPDASFDVGYADLIEFTSAAPSLTVLGLTSKRKWGAT
jgi:NAD+ kinase